MAFQMEFQKYSTSDKGKSTFIYALKQLCEEVEYIVPKNSFFASKRCEPFPYLIASLVRDGHPW